VTDFIQLLLHFYDKSTYDPGSIDTMTIAELKELERTKNILLKKNITAHPFCSLWEASNLLLKNKLHRLPLIDTSSEFETIIAVVTQYRILKHLVHHVPFQLTDRLVPRSNND
jgi:CBS-domain-containing membrane protein